MISIYQDQLEWLTQRLIRAINLENRPYHCPESDMGGDTERSSKTLGNATYVMSRVIKLPKLFCRLFRLIDVPGL